MKYFKSIITIFLAALFISSVYAQAFIPLDTYQVEDKIKNKISDAISFLAEEKDYIVNIQILKDVTKPKSSASVSKVTKSESIPIEKIKGDPDYLVYSRLGMSQTLPSVQNTEIKNAVSEPIKEFIKAITVEVLYNKDWSEAKVKQVNELLGKLKFSTAVVPKLNLTPISMKIEDNKPAPIKQEEKQKSFSDLSVIEMADIFSKFSTSLGVVLGLIVLGLMGFLAAGKFVKGQKEQTDALIKSNKEIAESQNQAAMSEGSVDVAQETQAQEESQVTNGDGGENDRREIEASLEKFQTFMQKNFKATVLFIKKWVAEDSAEAGEAVTLLAQEVESSELMKILGELNSSERQLWRQKVSNSVANDLLGANYIKKQILEEVIVPSDLLSEDTKALLFELSPDICVKIINEDDNLGALLFSTLSSNFLTKVVAKLESEKILSITALCAEKTDEDLKSLDGQLKAKIEENRTSKRESVFGGKVFELMPHVEPSKQQVFLSFIGQQGNVEKLESAIYKYFPLEGIDTFDNDSLKFFLSKLPQKNLVDLVVASDDDISSKYLNAVAPEGSPKREMLDLEINNIRNNELEVARVKKNKAEVELFFLNVVRKLINGNIQVREMVSPAIETLKEKYLGENYQKESAAA